MPANRDSKLEDYDATYEGQVVERYDPEGLGRVRVLVPGILDPKSDWIRPTATYGGSKDRGIWAVPKVGANVDVVFLHGDIHYPRYVAGPWGRPTGVLEVPAEAPQGNPDIVVMRFGDAAIVIDERSSQRKMTLLDVVNNSLIRLNIETKDVELTSLNDELVSVTRDEIRGVGRDRKITVGRDDEVQVTGNWKITVTGNAEIAASGPLQLDGSPDIKGGAGASAFVVLATIKAWLDAHVHGGVTAGGASTSAPTVPSPTTDYSTKFKAE